MRTKFLLNVHDKQDQARSHTRLDCRISEGGWVGADNVEHDIQKPVPRRDIWNRELLVCGPDS